MAASYRDIQTAFDSFFAEDEWTSQGITTVPMNFQGDIDSQEFARVGFFIGNPTDFVAFNDPGAVGFGEVNIFTNIADGERRSFEIADILDTLIQGRTIGSIQFLNSNLIKVGRDPNNPSLWRVDYQIPFRAY